MLNISKRVFLFLFLLASAAMQAQTSNAVPGELLVRIRPGYSPSDIEEEFMLSEGLIPQLHTKECVSEYMRIWLFTFDEESTDKVDMIRKVNSMRGVEIAQVNHILEERIVPDDPFLGQQWHHIQSEDHDIDTDLAWDVTTGGTTTEGDEIVVCIVELNGAKWTVTDIADNHWMNTNEVAGNGIDDDLNGYIDDYDGWNAGTLTDDLTEGDHGTRVCSMIGAKGNNTTGIAGVNWNVKLMMVEITGATEASAIAGYTYPMQMRKLYNQTNGERGAFIVATNSSWGSNGQPADAPLWCAMYDSLGTYGVLSCGATTNSNANVDITGDLPTACPSEYLLSVGRTNAQDLRASGGYGLTTIDLMAPGDNVYLANNSSYATTTGTSFSSPCVAGAIALLYSAPCASIMQIVNASPTEGALMMRDYINDGVDQTAQLLTETVSGGRLNVNNSLNLLLDECSNNGCLVPVGISHQQQDLTLNYLISWSLLEGINSFNVRYRIVGSDTWNSINNNTTTSVLLSDLLSCAQYEIQVMSVCTDVNSNWTGSYTWTTDGCCENPDLINLVSAQATSAEIVWNPVMAAEAYTITLLPAFGEMVVYENVLTNSLSLTDLDSCMMYTVIVNSICGSPEIETGELVFHTTGCDQCSDLSYCTVEASSTFEHIALVVVGDINRTSAGDGGYILVTDYTDTLHAQSQYAISLAPGYAGNTYNENFIAWIDYNSDGDFDELNELIFDAPIPTTETINGNFTVPSNVQDGVVRLRVAMRYTTGTSPVEPTYCGAWAYGEIEDYCVTLDHVVGVEEKTDRRFLLYPNPTTGELTFELNSIQDSDPISISFVSMDGSIALERNNFHGKKMDVSSLSPGIYSVVIRTKNECVVKKIVRQ